jgi:hypothetical protein
MFQSSRKTYIDIPFVHCAVSMYSSFGNLTLMLMTDDYSHWSRGTCQPLSLYHYTHVYVRVPNVSIDGSYCNNGLSCTLNIDHLRLLRNQVASKEMTSTRSYSLAHQVGSSIRIRFSYRKIVTTYINESQFQVCSWWGPSSVCVCFVLVWAPYLQH